jgi:hypothetical protein
VVQELVLMTVVEQQLLGLGWPEAAGVAQPLW